MQHCILASCRITKDDEDCQEESPPKYLGYPPCISKDIETFSWCKQPMGEEEIYTSRMEEYSHSYIEPLMSTHDAKRGCRRQTFSSYKLQLLTVLNNCYKLQQLNTLNTWVEHLGSLQKRIGLLGQLPYTRGCFRTMDSTVLQCFLLWIIRSTLYYLNASA